MSKERACAGIIRQIAGETGYETHLCRVIKVNGATCDVERVLDDKEIKDVRLNATIQINDSPATEPADSEPALKPGNNVLVIEPVINSYVLVTNIDGDKCFVSQFSAIQKITLNVADGIEINGGKNGGLIMIKELTVKINELVNWCKDHTHTNASFSGTMNGTTSITGTLTVPKPPEKDAPKSFDRTHYENDKIKH